jgi:hypothetical protein
MQVKFKFDVDAIVQTPLGAVGIVTACSVDDSRALIYYVRFAEGTGAWFPERQLTARE